MTDLCRHNSVVTQRSVPSKSVCDDCGMEVRRLWVAQDQAVVDHDTMASIDRNARAYGYEVGKTGELVAVVENTSPDNPFLDPNWRDRLAP